jgi:hypothetical protein
MTTVPADYSEREGLLARWAVTGGGFARVEPLVEPGNLASQRVLEGRGSAARDTSARTSRSPADALIYSLLPADL